MGVEEEFVMLLITICFYFSPSLLGQAHIFSSYVHIFLYSLLARHLGLGPILPSLLLEIMCKLIENRWKFV